MAELQSSSSSRIVGFRNVFYLPYGGGGEIGVSGYEFAPVTSFPFTCLVVVCALIGMDTQGIGIDTRILLNASGILKVIQVLPLPSLRHCMCSVTNFCSICVSG